MPIAINVNINTIINATAIRLPGKNLAIKIIFYINFIGKNLKLATELKQKPINITIIIVIEKAGPKQKSINIAIIIVIKKAGLKQKPINIGTAIIG